MIFPLLIIFTVAILAQVCHAHFLDTFLGKMADKPMRRRHTSLSHLQAVSSLPGLSESPSCPQFHIQCRRDRKMRLLPLRDPPVPDDTEAPAFHQFHMRPERRIPVLLHPVKDPPLPPPMYGPPPFCPYIDEDLNRCCEAVHTYYDIERDQFDVTTRCLQHRCTQAFRQRCYFECGEYQAEKKNDDGKTLYFPCCSSTACIRNYKKIRNRYLRNFVKNGGEEKSIVTVAAFARRAEKGIDGGG